MPAPSKATRELSAIKLVDPKRFHREVNSVLRISKTVLDAADKLQVSHATLKRWILADPGLVEGCTLRSPGNPEFGAKYDGKRRGKDKAKRKRRTSVHKSKKG